MPFPGSDEGATLGELFARRDGMALGAARRVAGVALRGPWAAEGAAEGTAGGMPARCGDWEVALLGGGGTLGTGGGRA
ncbi:MAG TPA: hypothetical protein PKA88_05150 [Polyangiaceae bacterium]|nr:hypothetical protein [Polyangiaceae bacterium]